MSQVPGRHWMEYAVFWTISVWFLASYFSMGENIERIDLIYTLLFHISILFGVSVNSFLLIPRVLAKGKTLIYILLFFLLLEICIQLNQFTFTWLSDIIFPDYYFISYYERLDLFYFMIAYLGITSLIQFSRSWFKESDAKRRLAQIEQEKTRHELQALRSQIQPHFLFNSLNTIYGLIRKQSSKAEDAVLKLSELLRYTIRQSDREEVPLTQEIDYLKDYIGLQKMRMNKPDGVSFSTSGDLDSVTIIPLLLIVFVENGFKYADLESGEPLIFSISVKNQVIRFSMRNKIAEENAVTDPEGERNGTGILNAKKRLELHYPGRHRLQIDVNEKEKTYSLDLMIQTEAA
ncbi:MAG: histidine kinase [Balneolaceae bacterium]|nr:histidine kinase [Balneolaceae bacterium]